MNYTGLFNRTGKILLGTFIVFLLITQSATSSTIRVKPDGNDANTGESWELAKQSLTAAIDAAEEGDEIWVAAGTYYEQVKNKVINTTQAINIGLYGGFAGTETTRNERDWKTNETILHGSNTRSVVQLTFTSPDFRLDGFTIKAGHNDPGHSESGGAIGIKNGAPVITHNFITLNISENSGTITIYGSLLEKHPLITDNIIAKNYAKGSYGDGGGILCKSASPTITGNTIAFNEAQSCGGGICTWESSSPLITRNLILGNTSPIRQWYCP